MFFVLIHDYNSVLYWFSLLQFWLLQLHLYMTLLYSYSFHMFVVVLEAENLKNVSKADNEANDSPLIDGHKVSSMHSGNEATGDVLCNGHESQDRNMNLGECGEGGQDCASSPLTTTEHEGIGQNTRQSTTPCTSPSELNSPTSPTSPNPEGMMVEADTDLKSEEGSEGQHATNN